MGGVGLVLAVLGVGGPKVKKDPLQPISCPRRCRLPMVPVGGHHEHMLIPRMHVNGAVAHLPQLPRGRPRLHPHLVVL